MFMIILEHVLLDYVSVYLRYKSLLMTLSENKTNSALIDQKNHKQYLKKIANNAQKIRSQHQNRNFVIATTIEQMTETCYLDAWSSHVDMNELFKRCCFHIVDCDNDGL